MPRVDMTGCKDAAFSLAKVHMTGGLVKKNMPMTTKSIPVGKTQKVFALLSTKEP